MSAAMLESANAPERGRHYGLLEFGAEWDEADRVLVAVHGRAREPDELAQAILADPRAAGLKVLAPWVAPRSWYDGRYDAPLGELAAARDAGLEVIAASLEMAHGAGRGPIFLAGFSQGGCMSVEYLLSHGASGLSGAAIFTGCALDIARRASAAASGLDGLPVLLSGGDTDPWIAHADLGKTAALLEKAGARLDFDTYSDAEHLVRPHEVARLLRMMSDRGTQDSSDVRRSTS